MKLTCDRCGKNIEKEFYEEGGNCTDCGDNLCKDCAGEWDEDGCCRVCCQKQETIKELGETASDKDFYCSGNHFKGNVCSLLYDTNEDLFLLCQKHGCTHGNFHRKHPTPEQFKAEYGFEVSDNMPVWVLVHITPKVMSKDGEPLPEKYVWTLEQYGNYKKQNSNWNIACNNMSANFCLREIEGVFVACTPFAPERNWRPR